MHPGLGNALGSYCPVVIHEYCVNLLFVCLDMCAPGVWFHHLELYSAIETQWFNGS